VSNEYIHQSSLEQRCADLELLLETERGHVKELEACRERLEGRVGELVKEVTVCEGRGGEGGQGEDSVRGAGQGEGNWSSLRVDDAVMYTLDWT